mgnify:CR=1 FL=1|tara:strand:+ start:2258 stop:2743 length:486 start_codon:yes stop_codon:yes gene_type:complete
MISDSYIRRVKSLAGIICEDNVELKSKTGRSDEGTLGWFSEDYLLSIGSKILNGIDSRVDNNEGLILKLLKSSTKISANSLFINIIISGEMDGESVEEEFDIVLTVQFSNDSNTVASTNYKGVNSRFNLNSKHSSEDLDLFKDEIVENIFNSIKLSRVKQK